MLLPLVPALPVASATHCGGPLTEESHEPAKWTEGTIPIIATFKDAMPWCGLASWYVCLNAECRDNAGTWTRTDTGVSVRYDWPDVEEGAYTVTVGVRESCGHSDPATCPQGVAQWAYTVTRDCGWDVPLLSTTPTGQVTTKSPKVEAVMRATPDCELTTWQMFIDDVLVPSTYTRGTDIYTVTHQAVGLSEGTHKVFLNVAESCCRYGGEQADPQTFSWEFTVGSCGFGTQLAAVEWSPSGVTPKDQPLIKVRFRDPDVACPLSSWNMTLDGQSVAPTVAQEGTDHVLTYAAPLLLPGPHRVTVDVQEKTSGARGAAAFGFQVLAQGGTAGINQTIPGTGGATSVDAGRVEAGCAQDHEGRDVLCWPTIALPGAQQISIGYRIHPSTVSAGVDPGGTYYVEEREQQTPFGPVTIAPGGYYAPVPVSTPYVSGLVELWVQGQHLSIPLNP